ncbi:methyltransferase type 12 [Colletotrichum plurivorum]|uniref:Methyltransferase type 12 n=1 Tax=Colletotrichum plurivorum TaxID=2175906 RepID=A0A8H6K7P1_9PEZI|nr:methyltransferase type 12 [Colletotrichum plurivorum]
MTIEERPEQERPATPTTATRKADFNSIYNQPDPRAYFSALKPLEYQVPHHALPFVERVLKLSAGEGKTRKVLDVCCSYGINAALIRCDVDLDELTEYFASSEESSREELVVRDKAFFQKKLRREDVEVYGLDVAPEAVRYGIDTGLMSRAWAQDLETSHPSPALSRGLSDIEVVVCTGGVGYISATTFERIISCTANPENLWIVSFVLRVYEFDDIAEMLKTRWGLVTKKIEGRVFRQRRFVDEEEKRGAVEVLRRKGRSVEMEEGGWFWAEGFVCRPGDWGGDLGW